MTSRLIQWGCQMNCFESPAGLADDVKALIAQAEASCETDPVLHDVAAMVYVGDVYALRELVRTTADPAWGERSYACGFEYDPL